MSFVHLSCLLLSESHIMSFHFGIFFMIACDTFFTKIFAYEFQYALSLCSHLSQENDKLPMDEHITTIRDALCLIVKSLLAITFLYIVNNITKDVYWYINDSFITVYMRAPYAYLNIHKHFMYITDRQNAKQAYYTHHCLCQYHRRQNSVSLKLRVKLVSVLAIAVIAKQREWHLVMTRTLATVKKFLNTVCRLQDILQSCREG